MSDIAPLSNPINAKALASFEVDAVFAAGQWYTRRGYRSVRVEPLENPDVQGTWLGLYRVIAEARLDRAPGGSVYLVCSKDALVIGEMGD